MRIIAGIAKRRSIQAPKGRETRPTQDYIREALFNIIQGYCEDSICLDLFAGSGALGLEAISRYAKYCIFCDKDYKAYNQIIENISILGFEDKSKVLKCDWSKALDNITDTKFNIVFLDPPYKFNDFEILFEKLKKNNLLCKDAIIIVERDKDHDVLSVNNFIHITRKEYGISNIDIYRYEEVNE